MKLRIPTSIFKYLISFCVRCALLCFQIPHKCMNIRNNRTASNSPWNILSVINSLHAEHGNFSQFHHAETYIEEISPRRNTRGTMNYFSTTRCLVICRYYVEARRISILAISFDKLINENSRWKLVERRNWSANVSRAIRPARLNIRSRLRLITRI